jgi:hypothetical protein
MMIKKTTVAATRETTNDKNITTISEPTDLSDLFNDERHHPNQQHNLGRAERRLEALERHIRVQTQQKQEIDEISVKSKRLRINIVRYLNTEHSAT